MTTKRIFHGVFCFTVAAFLSVGLSTAALGTPEQSIENLRDAYRHLIAAQPIYKNHRMRAIGHVRNAMRLAGGGSTFKKSKIEKKSSSISPGDSDSHMHMAQQCLQQSRSGLSPAAGEKVDLAIKEIGKGLSDKQQY